MIENFDNAHYMTLPSWFAWLAVAHMIITIAWLGVLTFLHFGSTRIVALMLQAIHTDINTVGTMIGERFDADAADEEFDARFDEDLPFE